MTDPRFLVGFATDTGRVRSMNEDSFVVTDRVFAVADGMGGHLAGEVASAMAADGLRHLMDPCSTDDAVNAVIAANHAILDLSRNDPSHRGMGTTLTGVVAVRVDDNTRLAVINVGDSRTYRLRAGKLEQVSIDHSYVQELVNAGYITEAEARVHPQRNIVTRALGIEAGIGIDVWTLPAVRGDRFLSCSDGLVDEVTDDIILDALCDYADPQAAAEELVRLANAAGGRDNTTVVVLDVLDGEDPAVVDDHEDMLTYITVRGTESHSASDETRDETNDFTVDPEAREILDGDDVDVDPMDDSDSDDTPPFETNPPRDLTAAVLSHGRDPSNGYPVAHADETPNTLARRMAMQARANTRFIIAGAAVAVIAIVLVIIAALTGGKSGSSPKPGDTVAITDFVDVTADTSTDSLPDSLPDSVSDTIGDASGAPDTSTPAN
jgi:protein phosphatase